MKILIVCQHYYPEQFRITDICEELARRGHLVTVITGEPNYPMGEIFPGYEHGKHRHEMIKGVDVRRCFTIARRRGIFWRVLNYYSFSISSTIFARNLTNEYDIVLVNQLSPVMMARAGISYAKKHNRKVIIYALDLWPECLTAGGIQRGSLLFRYYHHVSKIIYKSADKILVGSQSYIDYFYENFGIGGDKIVYLPQYSEALFSPDECIKKDSKTIDLMFAGNVGKVQSVETIIRAAALTKEISNLRWHIVGDGIELEHCKALAKNLATSNVIFHGRKNLEEMPALYAMADAMLVTMSKNDFISKTLPGKIQTYMASGKAILGSISGEAERVIKAAQCGLCCEAENYKRFADIALDFIKTKNKNKMMENSRKFYENNFSASSFFEKLERELKILSQ